MNTLFTAPSLFCIAFLHDYVHGTLVDLEINSKWVQLLLAFFYMYTALIWIYGINGIFASIVISLLLGVIASFSYKFMTMVMFLPCLYLTNIIFKNAVVNTIFRKDDNDGVIICMLSVIIMFILTAPLFFIVSVNIYNIFSTSQFGGKYMFSYFIHPFFYLLYFYSELTRNKVIS